MSKASALTVVTGVAVLSSPTRSSRTWLPWNSWVEAILICSQAALCSSVDALTCIAAVAWLSAVRAISPRFAAAESTACAFSVAAVVTAPAAARVFSAATRIVESALSSSRLTR